MESLWYEEFILLQILLGCIFFGLITALWGVIGDRTALVRWGLLALLAAGLVGIPFYYHGGEILSKMKQLDFRANSISSYEADYYTTLFASLFLGITAIMSLIIQRALNKIPRIFLYPVLFYALLVIIYLGWRSYFGF